MSIALSRRSKFHTRISKEWIQRWNCWKIIKSPWNNRLSDESKWKNGSIIRRNQTGVITTKVRSTSIPNAFSASVMERSLLNCGNGWKTADGQRSLVWLDDYSGKTLTLLSSVGQWAYEIRSQWFKLRPVIGTEASTAKIWQRLWMDTYERTVLAYRHENRMTTMVTLGDETKQQWRPAALSNLNSW